MEYFSFDYPDSLPFKYLPLKKFLLVFFVIYATSSYAQNAEKQFNDSFKQLTDDPGFKHATISLYVINTTTGKPVTEVNTEVSVAPASCQKVITASTAFSLLGHDYTYKTTLGYTGN